MWTKFKTLYNKICVNFGKPNDEVYMARQCKRMMLNNENNIPEENLKAYQKYRNHRMVRDYKED